MASKNDGGDNKSPPLEQREVKVNAYPKAGSGRGASTYSRKVDKQLKQEIERAMDGADPDVDAQVEAAQGAVDDAKGVVDPNLIDHVEVEVSGQVDGQDREFDLTFRPSDEGSKDD